MPADAKINGVNVGNLAADKAAIKLCNQLEDNKVTLIKDNKEIGEINPNYKYDRKETENKLKKIIKKQKYNLFLKYKIKHGYVVELKTIGNAAKQLCSLDGNKYSKKTKNAYVDYDNLKLIKEVQGDNLDYIKLEEAFKKVCKKGKNIFSFNSSDYYKKPTITSKNKKLNFELEFAKQYLKGGLVIEKIKIKPSLLRKIIIPSDKNAVVSKKGTEMVLDDIIKNNNIEHKVTCTLRGKKRTFKDEGALTKIDKQKTINSIMKSAKSKIAGEEVPAIFYFTCKDIDYNKNFVCVSIKKQRLWFYKNGKVRMSTPVVTGIPKHFTPTGAFSVMWKERNATLRGREDNGKPYANKVKYWMPLTDMGVGLHDAPWRYYFGGEIYKTNGSHGCINMPTEKAKWLFNNITEKYPVFVIN